MYRDVCIGSRPALRVEKPMRPFHFLAVLPLLCIGACAADPSEDASSTADELAASCAFKAGSNARSTLSNVPKTIPIKHIIIVTPENRSFDHMLGSLRLEGHEVDGIPPGFVNKDKKGKDVHFQHRTDTCFDADSPHNEEAIESSIDGDKMDTFV